jgi:hypothetical protein
MKWERASPRGLALFYYQMTVMQGAVLGLLLEAVSEYESIWYSNPKK